MKKFFAFCTFLMIFFIIILILPYNKQTKSISITKGSSIYSIAINLKKQDIIISRDLFVILFTVFNKTPKAGYYEIKKGENLLSIFLKISEGKQDLSKVVIIPGDDLYKIAEKLEKAKVIKKEKFLNFFDNKFKLISIGFPFDSFEGFIIPDTYFLEKNLSEKRLYNIFLSKFLKNYSQINSEFYKKMIIASLIEKEAKTKKDKYLISSVIHNRLNKNMPLQIDATLIYLAKKIGYPSKGNITKLKNIHSPYNTYKNLGLPPTPICSFSKESLDAALNPAKAEYLFYFTKDGTNHIFSKTYKEHLKKLKEGKSPQNNYSK